MGETWGGGKRRHHILYLVGRANNVKWSIKIKQTPLRSWIFLIPYNTWRMEGRGG